MRNDDSLLAYLSPRFTERTEDIAVEALGYILSTSEAAKTGLLSILRSGGAKAERLIRVATQVAGDQGERPDLVGWNEHDDECLLIEAKFWAGLTPPQPNEYLKRLRRGGVLLFVSPEARLDSLWPELERRVKKEGSFDWNADVGNARAADVGGRRLILTSWRTLLEAAAHHAGTDGDIAATASIRQLNGLCEQEDEVAFVPLRPGELGPDLPRRLMNLHTIIGRVVARAKAAGLASTKELRTAATSSGYGQYLKLGVREEGSWISGRPVGAYFCLDYEAWSRWRETPLWLALSSWEGTLPLKKVRERLRSEIVAEQDETAFIPIYLPTGVELDDVVASVVGQLRGLANRIADVTPD